MATYFNDCSSLTGWTEQEISAGTQFSVSGGVIVNSAAQLEALSLDAVDSDGDRQDAELLIKCKVGTFASTHYMGIVRGSDSDSAGSASGYIVALRSGALRTYSKVNGTATQISSATKTHSNNTYYWVRLRVNSTGDVVKARSWADGGSEGGTWECDSTDTAVGVVDGYCGLHGDATTSTRSWAACGVGTNGDSAPTSASAGTYTMSNATWTNLTAAGVTPRVTVTVA